MKHDYTDEEIVNAYAKVMAAKPALEPVHFRLRAFLSALPRRESPPLADAIARVEKAESELFQARQLLATRVEASRLDEAVREARDAQAELAALKSAQLGILRPIAEMPENVPEGFTMVFGSRNSYRGVWDICDILSSAVDTHFAILRLPAAEATPPAKVDPYAELKAAHADGKVIQVNIGKWGNPEAEDMWEDREEPAWDIEPEFYRIKPEPAADATTIAKCAINNTEQNVQFRATAGYGTWGAADTEPAAQVPLGLEDCPPGSVFRWPGCNWVLINNICEYGMCIKSNGFPDLLTWKAAMDGGGQINTSLAFGRWDTNAWRSCSKPAGKEVAK